MRTFELNLSCKKTEKIILGRQGENLVTDIIFDFSAWLEEFGEGAISLIHQRAHDAAPYPVLLDIIGTRALWHVRNSDTQDFGLGFCELQYIVGDQLAKSRTYDTQTARALGTASETPPEPWEGWVEAVLAAADRAEAAADRAEQAVVHAPYIRDTDKHWMVWDVELGEYVDTGVVAEGSGGGESHPYISLSREGAYFFNVTFGTLPPETDINVPVGGGCSSYVADGKLCRNLDWDYSETASFHVICKGFEGMSFLGSLTDGNLNDRLIGQLPYHINDGRNDYGIRVSSHVLYNDWEWQGTGNIPLTKIPFIVLSQIHSLDNFAAQMSAILADVYAPAALVNAEYLLQFLVTDGTTTYVIMPPTSSSGSYVVVNATANPKLTNFRWVEDETVTRTQLQRRPTGVERWNEIPGTNLEGLRFTLAYEAPTRLSEFIGICGTDKDSTDAELTTIYNEAHALYEQRTRDGRTWQTMHSVVYSADKIDHLWVQENYDRDYAHGGTGGTTDHTQLMNRDAADQHPISSITGLEDALAEKQPTGDYAYTDDLDAVADRVDIIEGKESGWDAKYSKPSAGIPKTDLASGVQSSLSKADSALQEHQSLAAYRTASQQDVIDSGKQATISDLETIRSGAAAGATAVQPAAISDMATETWVEQQGYDTEDSVDAKVAAVQSDVDGIAEVISPSATTTNKLVSAQEMGDAISSVEAKQLYATASQGSFATKDALTSATTYYNADGTVATPTKNDVAYVLADESHSGKSAKYVIAQTVDGVITWGFVITFSDTTFTQTQMDAINSNATADKISSYDAHVSNNNIHVTAAQKEAWSGKQDAISDLANIRSGAALGATALQSVPNTYRTAAAQDVIDSGKQDKLVSGTNIKTFNGNSILGSGNLSFREMPSVTSADAGKFARVNDSGVWVAEAVPQFTGGDY